MNAEKRSLTILCCDLVDSTILADLLDPEEFETLIQSFFDISIEILKRNRGVFAHHSGDGFQAYFYPGANLSATNYAVKSGLDILHSLKSKKTVEGEMLDARVGISTGQVVLSSHQRSTSGKELIAFGPPAHLADRLQSIADPGTLCVDETTFKLAKPYYNFSSVGELMLKGFSSPVKVWKAEHQRQWESRFEERLPTLAPLVGRGEEIALMMKRWESVKNIEGQGVVIIGEPGIGKSRLVYEVCLRIGQAPLSFQCLENHENTPLHPWRRFLENLSHINSRDSIEDRKEKLKQTLKNKLDLDKEHQKFLLSLMQYSSDSLSENESTYEIKLNALFNAIVNFMVQRAQNETQTIVVEDIQWIDPTSKVLLDTLIEKLTNSSIFILITCRPENVEFHSTLNMTHLSLNRLTRDQTKTLAISFIETQDSQRIEEIIDWSEGIPFYVEEMSKITNEASSHYRASEMSVVYDHRPEIPDSLQITLLARLDGLGTSKQIAQFASVIGRDFELETLALLKSTDTQVIYDELKILIDAGILIRRQSARESFSFKHALIQEATYNSLLDRDLLVLHKRLADIYQHEFPGMCKTQPEVLAHHLSLSQEWEAAAEFWLQAGLAARDTGSHLEAKGRLERGLEAVNQLGNTRNAKRLKAHFQMALGQVIISHFGPVNKNAHDAFNEAVQLGEELGDEYCVVTSQTSLLTLRYVLGTFRDTQAEASKLIEYATRVDNYQAAAVGLLGSGMCQFAMGKFKDAREHLEQSIEYLKFNVEPAEGYPSKAFTYLGLIHYITGDPKKGEDLCEYSIDISSEHSMLDLAASLGNSLYLHTMQHHLDRIENTSHRLMELSQEKGFMMWYYQGAFFLGSVLAARHFREGLKMMDDAMERFHGAQEKVELSIFYGTIADRCLSLGEIQLAEQWADKGLNHVCTYEEHFIEAPLLRLKARCLEHSNCKKNADEIDYLYQKANKIALAQGAVAWQGFSKDSVKNGFWSE